MQRTERHAISSLAAIMAFRMLGLFMILPVFSVYAEKLPHATATLVGLALGIYGLTQALLQIPFGMMSDRIGRKPIIALGLMLFALGSVVAALSHGIGGIILGRALQGAGAIGSTTLAMVSDLTRDESRSKAMAFVGFTIGLAFIIAMVLGPVINSFFDMNGIFWFTALLALVGIGLLYTTVPQPPKVVVHQDNDASTRPFINILKNKELLRLDLGIFTMHASLTAVFIALPILLTHHLGLSEAGQIMMYIIVLIFAFATMVPFIIIAEKRRRMKSIFLGSIMALLLSQIALLFLHAHAVMMAFILLIFFAAFTLLEASLPSLVSKIAPIKKKGAAMGVYSTSQFLGIFFGGALGGVIFSHFGISGVFAFTSVMLLVWLSVAFSMKQPPYLSTLIFTLTQEWQDKTESVSSLLRGIPGVAEVVIMVEENLIYTKVDKHIVDKTDLEKALKGGEVNG